MTATIRPLTDLETSIVVQIELDQRHSYHEWIKSPTFPNTSFMYLKVDNPVIVVYKHNEYMIAVETTEEYFGKDSIDYRELEQRLHIFQDDLSE